MAEDLAADLEVLERHLNAKKMILREVLEGASRVPSARNTIRQVLQVEPKLSIEDSLYEVACTSSQCLESDTYWTLSVSSRADTPRSVSVLLSPTVTTRWQLCDRDWNPVHVVEPGGTCQIILCAPSLQLITADSRFAIIDFRSIEHELLGDSIRPESVVVELPSAADVFRIEDIPRQRGEDARKLLNCLSVGRACASIPQIRASNLQHNFPNKFDVADYGSFQIAVGKGEFIGVVLHSQSGKGSNLDRLLAPTTVSLRAFAAKLAQLAQNRDV